MPGRIGLLARPLLSVGLSLLAQSALAGHTPHVTWIRQLGTSGNDIANRLSADGLGNVYIGGSVAGSLGQPYCGDDDVLLAKYDAAGNLVWTRQFGTDSSDSVWGLDADRLGNVFFTGRSWGPVAGPNPNPNHTDVFVGMLDADGTQQWVRPISSDSGEVTFGISADGLGNAYTGGHTGGELAGPNAGSWDTFLAAYDADGSRAWLVQHGTADNEQCRDVSTDGLGSVYTAGLSYERLAEGLWGDADAVLSKCDAAGNLVWQCQLGTASDDMAWGVSADPLGNVFVGGETLGTLGESNEGGSDAFVATYDSEGEQLWKHQFGSSAADRVWRVATDGLGNAFVAGSTEGALAGDAPAAGMTDGFVAKYDAAGNQLWLLQFDSMSYGGDGWGLSADGLGHVYLSGSTYGSLDGANAGGMDAFVIAISEAPEPGTWALCGTGLLLLAGWRLMRRRRPAD